MFALEIGAVGVLPIGEERAMSGLMRFVVVAAAAAFGAMCCAPAVLAQVDAGGSGDAGAEAGVEGGGGGGAGPDLTDPSFYAAWLSENGPSFVVAVAKVLAILLIGLLVSGWAARVIRAQGERRKHLDVTLARFIANIVRWAILALAGILCLGAFGVETTSFAALIAAAGLAIGLALQGSLSNFAAGSMLLIFRPFKVGDYVHAGGESGTVQEIDLLTTTLDTPQNVRVVVPNSAVFGGTITNYTHHSVRRCDIEVGVSYDADVDETRRVLERAIGAIEERVAEPASVAFLKSLGGSSVDWVCRIWVPADVFWVVHEKATRSVKVELDAAGIGIPYPQLDVHVDRVGVGDA